MKAHPLAILLALVCCLTPGAPAAAQEAPPATTIPSVRAVPPAPPLPPVTVSNPAPIVDGKIGEKLDDYLSRLEAYGFHGAALYAKKDRIYLRKAYGYASIEERRRNTTDTLFDIASVSKQFTAAAILRLQMHGKLHTSDPVTRFFPQLGDDKSGILLYHLLNHTSGLPADVPVTSETHDRDEFIRLLAAAPTDSDPGEQFVYNNLNFALLGAIIEVVSGRPYESFMRDEVFFPAGMNNVYFVGDHLPKAVHAAMAHDGDWEMWSAEEAWYSWGLRAAAGILCSLDDLYKWELALRNESVLDHPSTLELFNRFLPTYTYGWFARDDAEKKTSVFYHSGNTRGFQAYFERCPADGSVLILLINMAGKIDPVSHGLRSLIEGHGASMPPKPISLPPERLARLAGRYTIPDIGDLSLTADDDGAIVARDYGLLAVAARLKERSEDDLKRAPRYDNRARDALHAWLNSDLQPIDSTPPLQLLQDLLPDGREHLAEQFTAAWRVLGQAGGGLIDIKVLGTIPISLDELHTYVAFVSHDRTDVIKLIWHDGDLRNWDHTYPAVMRFIPIGETEFISFEITDEVTPRDRAMKFVLDDNKDPARVAILIDFNRLFADRKPN